MTLSIVLVLPLLWMAVFGGTTQRLIALGLAACLADAALINVGVSVNVNWLMVLVVVGWFVLELKISPPPAILVQRSVEQVIPVILFWVWNGILIVSAPFIFTHINETMPGSSEFDPRLAVPLAAQGESFNQQIYLLLCIMLAVVISVTLAREPALMMKRMNALITAMFAAAAFWFYWQVASINFGVPFPDALLHNDLHSKAWNQKLGGALRPSGSMPEPSAVASFFLPFPFYFFERYLASRDGRLILLILTSLGVMYFSTSTTAYAGIALFLLWVAMRGLGGGASLLAGGRILIKDVGAFLAFLGLLVVGGAGAWIFLIDPTVAETIFREQILEKSTSLSARQRGYANDLGVEIFLQSYGVGVGMGNHRTSTIVVALLCGGGIIGFALMAWYFFQIAWRAMRRWRVTELLFARRAFAVSVGWGAILLSAIMIGGELQSVQLWIWAGCLMALNVAPLPRPAPPRRRSARPAAPAPVRAPGGAAARDGG